MQALMEAALNSLELTPFAQPAFVFTAVPGPLDLLGSTASPECPDTPDVPANPVSTGSISPPKLSRPSHASSVPRDPQDRAERRVNEVGAAPGENLATLACLAAVEHLDQSDHLETLGKMETWVTQGEKGPPETTPSGALESLGLADHLDPEDPRDHPGQREFLRITLESLASLDLRDQPDHLESAVPTAQRDLSDLPESPVTLAAIVQALVAFRRL